MGPGSGAGTGAGRGYRPAQPEALLRPRLPGQPGELGRGAEPLPPHPHPAEPHPAGAGLGEPGHAPADGGRLPLLPGFREMAARRLSGSAQQAIAELAAQRASAGLSQTQVAARMGTSQSAVARLESGDADVRVSTLERYAAAVGSQLSWQVRRPGRQPGGGF